MIQQRSASKDSRRTSEIPGPTRVYAVIASIPVEECTNCPEKIRTSEVNWSNLKKC